MNSYNKKNKQNTEFDKIRAKSLELAKIDLNKELNTDIKVIEIIKTIRALDKTRSLLAKRLREISHHFFPRLAKSDIDIDELVQKIEERIKTNNIEEAGATLDESSKKLLNLLIGEIKNKTKEKEKLIKHIKELLERYCPRLVKLAGPIITAELIEHAGSLKRLASWPASTIQVLGAEKALFKHLIFKTKPPKYGVLYQHPLVQEAKQKDKGKVARRLADKIVIAARQDFFSKHKV